MNNGEIIIYQAQDGQTAIDVRLEGETVWLSQAQMAELFDTDRTSVLRHIKNIYKTGELEENPTCAFFAQVRTEGRRTVTRQIPYYNLDVIISVGYRVNSIRGTQFRIWANRVLKEFLVKGYVVDNKLAQQKYEELSQLVKVLGRTIKTQPQITKPWLVKVGALLFQGASFDTPLFFQQTGVISSTATATSD